MAHNSIDAVGAIDATSNEIYRLLTEHKNNFALAIGHIIVFTHKWLLMLMV